MELSEAHSAARGSPHPCNSPKCCAMKRRRRPRRRWVGSTLTMVVPAVGMVLPGTVNVRLNAPNVATMWGPSKAARNRSNSAMWRARSLCSGVGSKPKGTPMVWRNASNSSAVIGRRCRPIVALLLRGKEEGGRKTRRLLERHFHEVSTHMAASVSVQASPVNFSPSLGQTGYLGSKFDPKWEGNSIKMARVVGPGTRGSQPGQSRELQ